MVQMFDLQGFHYITRREQREREALASAPTRYYSSSSQIEG